MSQPKTKRKNSWVGWIVSALLIAGSLLLWTERQFVVDTIQYRQFKPTPAIETMTKDIGLTDDSKFTFYATHPVIESSEAFNQHCQRKEADSPILGCYAANRIYIFDVTDERLNGLKEVTAAHELLHAEYERLPDAEKKRLQPLLQAEYKKVSDSKLQARMDYYEKTEPGESFNELHSIIGTEYESLSPELERYYGKYFTDRAKIVAMHKQVDSTFTSLSEEADTLVNQIEKLAFSINSDTKTYNTRIETLNQSVDNFNQRASQNGGFTTQAEFQAARQNLTNESSSLNELRQSIQLDIAEYKMLLSKLDSINAQSASLNQSLDSTLSDAPKI